RHRGDVARLALGVVHLDVALGLVVGPRALRADLRPVDLAVGGDVEADRAVRVAHDHGAGEVRPDGAAAVGLLALAGDPADAADQVVHERVVAVVFGVDGGVVADARDPGAAVVVGLGLAGAVLHGLAVVGLAPGDRVILAHAVRTRVVGPLVEVGEHVVRAADVALPVVVLVGDLP